MKSPRRSNPAQTIRRRSHPAKARVPALEWMDDWAVDGPRITAFGSHRLLVENHTGILDFCDTRVRLSTRKGSLCVFGSGLCLSQVRPGSLVVLGDILRVDIPCEGRRPDEG